MPKPDRSFRQIAAIDLGSNSFHLVVARLDRGEIRILDRRSEKIQLGAGFDANDNLGETVQARALDCLRRYAQRIAGLPPGAVRVVGTNALRRARNSEKFIARAQKVLGHPIDIVAGREEARLIYLGVSHTMAGVRGRRLVVDIGGGSTECIVGQQFEPLLMESLHMGCVAYNLTFFPKGVITADNFAAAVTAAHQELLPVRKALKSAGWKSAVGSSGTIKAIQQVLEETGLSDYGISRDGLYALQMRVLKAGRADRLDLPGLATERQGIFAPGLAILIAVFEALDIDFMEHSIGALREGALYDLLGRIGQEDVRDRAVLAMLERNHADQEQAERVAGTAMKLFDQVRRRWQLGDEDRDLLRRAALMHEIGLDISHSNYQKHGAYLVQHADLPGFSRQEQHVMAAIVRNQRRKLALDVIGTLPTSMTVRALRLSLLMRLAVILHHGRSEKRLPPLKLTANERSLVLTVPAGWKTRRSLALADLEDEAWFLKAADYTLTVRLRR